MKDKKVLSDYEMLLRQYSCLEGKAVLTTGREWLPKHIAETCLI
jgi:hypothetical protein